MNGLLVFIVYVLLWLPALLAVGGTESWGFFSTLDSTSIVLLAPLPVAVLLQLGGRELLDQKVLWWTPLRRLLPAGSSSRSEDDLRAQALTFTGSYRISRSLLAVLPAVLLWIGTATSLARGSIHLFAFWSLLFGASVWAICRILAAIAEGKQASAPWRTLVLRVGLPFQIAVLTATFLGGYIGLFWVLPIGWEKHNGQINGMFALIVYMGVWMGLALVIRTLSRWGSRPGE